MKFEYRNAYVCQKCRYVTLTVHIDEGVTPMFLNCRKPGGIDACDGTAVSFMYNLPGSLALSPDDKLNPTHEWYKPGPDQKLSDFEKDHVDNGGVLLRDRTDAAPILKERK